jgi:phosphatidylglycerol lysyltransferase
MILAEGIASMRLGDSLFALVALAVVLMAIAAGRRYPALARYLEAGGRISAALVPRGIALGTFLAGVILLFSGATPAKAGRIGWLIDVLPLPVIEVSAYFESIAGVALILLARGLQRRLDAAYHLTLWVLGAGIIFAVAGALDVEQAILLAVMLTAFLPCRRFFYRRSSLFDERFTTGWFIAIIGVLVATAALTWLAYGHQIVSSHVFWDFSDTAAGPRAVRGLTLAIVLLLALSLAYLLKSSRLPGPPTEKADVHVVERIIASSTRANAHLAMLGDKDVIVDPSGRAFLMTGRSGQSRVVMGDPVGAISAATALVDRFILDCDRDGSWPVFYRAGPQLLYLYLDYGLTVVKLGETARVELAGFSLDGPQRRNLRRVWRKHVEAGCSFEVIPAASVGDHLARLRAISNDWLEQKRAREKGFSLGRFDERFVGRGPVAIVRLEGEIIAFATLWVTLAGGEVEVDLMRHTADAPGGVMRYLLTEAMLWAAREGYAWFNLGMVPLAGIRTGTVAPLWNQLVGAMRIGGERYYNFEGLREFKAWFYPEWEPSYLVSPGGTRRPMIIANIAALIAGSARGIVRR